MDLTTSLLSELTSRYTPYALLNDPKARDDIWNADWNAFGPEGEALKGGFFILGALGKKVLPILKSEWHHIASKESIKSGFTALYKMIFSKAGMTLEDAANQILLQGHSGAHTKEYKQYILRYLRDATNGLKGTEYKNALIKALNELKAELITNPKMPYKGGL